jgi:hypothetical protein
VSRDVPDARRLAPLRNGLHRTLRLLGCASVAAPDLAMCAFRTAGRAAGSPRDRGEPETGYHCGAPVSTTQAECCAGIRHWTPALMCVEQEEFQRWL